MIVDFLVAIYLATVLKVHDGDTIVVKPADSDKNVTVRLDRIDAPELDQPYGIEARDFLKEKVLNKEVNIEPLKKTDKYGRTLAEVYLPDEKLYLNRDLVAKGFAWRYVKYDRSKYSDLKVLEEFARDQKVGLWQGESPVAPWIFREQKKHKLRLIELEPVKDEN